MSKLVEREPAPGRPSLAAAPALAVQFFLIPLAVVGMVVLVYGGFRMLLSTERTPEDLLRDVQVGGRERRWPAAYELSRLMSDPAVEVDHPGLGDAVVEAFRASAGDDPRVRRYLALAIGRLASPPAEAVEALVGALEDPAADAETQISVIWALAAIEDPGVVGTIREMYAADDAGVRKMAVYALGALAGDARRDGRLETLQAALDDPTPDVQWNAAVALARHGLADGAVVLARMLDREYVTRNVSRTPAVDAALDPVSEVMISGLQAVAAIGGEALRGVVVDISETDESLRVREVALRTLEMLEQQDAAAREGTGGIG